MKEKIKNILFSLFVGSLLGTLSGYLAEALIWPCKTGFWVLGTPIQTYCDEGKLFLMGSTVFVISSYLWYRFITRKT